MPPDFPSLARSLAQAGRRFYVRGWALGTSGNYSAVWSHRPLQVAITASALPKGDLRARNVLLVDERGSVIGGGAGTPSAETLLHLEIVRRRGAGAVLHTHSVWGTALSDRYAGAGGFWVEGYEMLKGLAGIDTHEHREWVPIIANDQDMPRLAALLGQALTDAPQAHGILLRRHGLYTWGKDIAEAARHVEILEFLFEAVGRTLAVAPSEVSHGAAQSS